MGGLVAVALVAVVALTFLLYVWTDRRRTVRREELYAARTQAATGIVALEEIRREITIQLTANHPDLLFLQELVDQNYRKAQEIPQRKALPRF